MEIRRAIVTDIERIEVLLRQVLEIHAKIRPDIFISGTVKYTAEELHDMINDSEKPIYVAIEDGTVAGYAFCVIRSQKFTNIMRSFRTLFVDDLCVDERFRGKGIGSEIFAFLKSEAERLGCSEITLNLWEGNDAARAFYEKMGMRPKETQMELVIE